MGVKTITFFLGVGDYEKVEVLLPQFERIDGRKIGYIPRTHREYKQLEAASTKVLVSIGCQQWDENIWLYPAEWYDFIPEEYIVVNINGKSEPFHKGVTDDDRRFGVLAFGFEQALESEVVEKSKANAKDIRRGLMNHGAFTGKGRANQTA